MAGGNTISIELSAEDAKAVAAWQRQKSLIGEFSGSLDKAAGKSQKAGQTGQQMLISQAAGLTQMAAGFIGVGSAIQAISTAASLLRAEYDNLVDRQRGAADTQINLADAQRAAVANLGTAPELGATRQEQVQNLMGQIRSTSQTAGVDQLTATKAISDALSARGDKTATEAIAAVAAALKVTPSDTGATQILSGAALDIGKVTGMTPEQSIGALQSIGTASRVTSQQALAQNVAPAALGVSQFGGDFAESGAIVAAITQGMVDPTGERSRTTSISLAQQLEKFLPNETSTLERIRKLQGDDKLRQQFLGKSSFEKAALPTVRGLLESGTSQASGLDAALKTVVSGDQAGSLFNENVALTESLPAVQRQKEQLRFDQSVMEIQAGSGEAKGSVFREGLKKVLAAAGASAIGQKIDAAEFDYETDFGRQNVSEFASAELRQLAERTRGKQLVTENSFLGGKKFSSREASQEEKDRANVLERLAVAIEEMNTNRQTQVVEVKMNGNRMDADLTRGPAPKPFERTMDARTRTGGRSS